MFHDKLVETHNVHMENLEVVFAICALVFAHDMFNGFCQVTNALLVHSYLIAVALGLGQDHPAELLERLLMPVIQTVHCICILG